MSQCERTIDITNNCNYQESAHNRFDSFIIKLINPWFMTRWLTNEQMIDWMVNPIWFPIQVYRIMSIPVSFLLLSSYPPSFLCSDLFLFNEAKSKSHFSINDCTVLSIYWTLDSQTWIIIKYQSIQIIPLCHYQIQSFWLFEAISFLSILNKS